MPIEWNLNNRVVIRNLGETPTKSEITTLFGRCGRITKLWVARYPPGLAFLEYATRRSALTAVRSLNGKSCCGNFITVDLSSCSQYDPKARVSRRRNRLHESGVEGSRSRRSIQEAGGSQRSSIYSENVERSKSTSKSRHDPCSCNRDKDTDSVVDRRCRRRTYSEQRLNCNICFDNAIKRKPTITPCGHVFCKTCIEKALRKKEKCPTCKSATLEKRLTPILLNP